MAEVLSANLASIDASDVLSRLGLKAKKYILLSAHREENIDTENNFLSLFTAINKMAEKYDMPILYSCHPRSKKRLEQSGFKLDPRVIQHDYLEAEDVGMAVVKFKNGAIATIEGTTNVYPKNLEETLYVFGEHGTVKIGGTSTNNIDVWDFEDENEKDINNKSLKEATSNVYGNGHTSLFADMIDAIEKDREPYVDAVAGKNALELVLAIYKSQKEGVSVKLPLKNFSSTDMTGEF